MSNKSTVVKRVSEPESFWISVGDCQSTIVGSAAGPRLARLRREGAPKGGGVTRRRNRDAEQEAQARIYISVAPCAEKFLPFGVEIDVASFLRTLPSTNGIERSSASALRRSILHDHMLLPLSPILSPYMPPSPPRSPPVNSLSRPPTLALAFASTPAFGLYAATVGYGDTHIRQP